MVKIVCSVSIFLSAACSSAHHCLFRCATSQGRALFAASFVHPSVASSSDYPFVAASPFGATGFTPPSHLIAEPLLSDTDSCFPDALVWLGLAHLWIHWPAPFTSGLIPANSSSSMQPHIKYFESNTMKLFIVPEGTSLVFYDEFSRTGITIYCLMLPHVNLLPPLSHYTVDPITVTMSFFYLDMASLAFLDEYYGTGVHGPTLIHQ
ncbi:hypothetical protein Bca101_081793 [Brassica carinata]